MVGCDGRWVACALGRGLSQPAPATVTEPLISLTFVTADANLVAVRISHLSAIEVGMVFRAKSWCALVVAAQGGGAAMKPDDLSLSTCHQGYHLAVPWVGRLTVVRPPDQEERSLGTSRLPAGPWPGQIGEPVAPVEFRQHGGVKRKRSMKVANANVDM